ATKWEFTNRSLIFGLIFSFAFPLYVLDHQNSTSAFAKWLGPGLHLAPHRLARFLLACAALLLILAAFVRTWASSYLQADVVYAADVKTECLIADGPYRLVRNPLYFGNVLLVLGIGCMMSRLGFFVAIAAMLVFSYRLILREEAELEATQGATYERYSKAVPRLWPSPRPRIASSGRRANWAAGFKAESWYWGFPAALVAFAITLKVVLFFGILAATIALFWGLTSFTRRRADTRQAP
ncbi:MAG: isoprenylcysteine carboxylmethyltransferase family protein, partial [Acidobacteriaceae bacterium]|nr:isoprenylcysteine carboxylmethyltransferase family protein [Acidobacteriaceae bacterium]